ncbi:MAG: ASCH domain-containing protein [Proteobacteria bacterium]|nr:ASCH domain-containing protein [Pseudomonadota bacterium]
MTDSIEEYIREFMESSPEYSGVDPDDIDVYFFLSSFDEESANLCAALTSDGIKTAVSSLLWEYETEDMETPGAGSLAVITDWNDNPACVIEVTRVEVKAFDEVDEEHAHKEGEGDRSLEYWRKVHRDAFSAVCKEMGKEPSEKMPVVLEEFRANGRFLVGDRLRSGFRFLVDSRQSVELNRLRELRRVRLIDD